MKSLIITADDFGRSARVNEAIEHLHCTGLVTQASLMVNEPHAAQAAAIAHRHPRLCVGLHLTLCDGLASSGSALGTLPHSPTDAGLRYFFRRKLEQALQEEIRAQFERFRAFELPLTYWDGHAHLHLHPTVLRLAARIAAQFGFRFVRLVREPGPPALLPWIFHCLSAAARTRLDAAGMRYTDRVYGLRATGRMTGAELARILRSLPAGTNEIYCHPGAEPGHIAAGPLLEIIRDENIALTNSRELGLSTA